MDNIDVIAAHVIAALTERGLTLSTAESCTGGMIGAALTSIPGASSAYFGGVVSYDNTVKSGILGVKTETLDSFGAVSRECAEEMAEGAKKACGTSLAISVTGIAGPTGGTKDKPVGTVCFALASDFGTVSERVNFGSDSTRDEIRHESVRHALLAVLDSVCKNNSENLK